MKKPANIQAPDRAVVILGARFPALALVQSLAPRRVSCWVLAPRPLQAAWSRFATFRCLPAFTKDREQTVAELRELLRRIGNRPTVIPAGDIEAAALAHHYDELEPFAELCVSRKDTIDLVLDKRAFYAWTRHHEFSCPATASAAAELMPFDPPFAVKPTNYSIMLCNHQCFQQGPNPLGFKFRRIESMADWRDFQDRQRTNLEMFVAQKIVDGQDDDLMEINPRAWSWMQATAGTLADIAWTAYRDLCGEKIRSIQIVNADPGQIKVARALRCRQHPDSLSERTSRPPHEARRMATQPVIGMHYHH